MAFRLTFAGFNRSPIGILAEHRLDGGPDVRPPRPRGAVHGPVPPPRSPGPAGERRAHVTDLEDPAVSAYSARKAGSWWCRMGRPIAASVAARKSRLVRFAGLLG